MEGVAMEITPTPCAGPFHIPGVVHYESVKCFLRRRGGKEWKREHIPRSAVPELVHNECSEMTPPAMLMGHGYTEGVCH
ncbi:hypothetical protein EYF80_040213 [Liparis tanakae]|uniref:Uncharacterized protein n=1 Tax=Liparis tanakae TaxID=230148 RepID=A0A4Z2G983_9TELE|nr:hypothetical protein EYF80_040213 [Liparis tanakae]